MRQVPAASRTLLILKTLAASPNPMTAVAIARDLQLPRSSTYHLLNAMQELGFVVHYPEEERWGLGIGAFEIGTAYLRHDPLERLAKPVLQKSLKELHPVVAVAHLGVLHGNEVLYLLKQQPQRPLSTLTEIGVRLPANLTASGRSMLAQLPTSQVRALFPNKNAFINRTGKGPQTLAALLDTLKREKSQGFSSEVGFITDGMSTIAAAVLDRHHQPAATVSYTYPTDTVSQEDVSQIIKTAQHCARQISKRLGG